MPKTTPTQRNRHLVEDRLAFAPCALELVRDAEVEQAIALLETGKAKFVSHGKIMQEARKRIG